MRVTLIALVLGVLLCQSATAQWTYGFRAGLSYSKFLGDLESDASGQVAEDYRFASGFHIGLAVNYEVTDLFGFRGELVFTQRGTEYTYDGDSYYFLARCTPDQRLISGHRVMDLNISTANIEIPLNTYFRVGRFEFSGGVNVAFLLAATGGGSLEFEGMSTTGGTVEPFLITLSHNYIKDEAKATGPRNLPVRIDGLTTITAGTTGAYYDFDEKDGNRFKVIDIGLMGGLSYFLNEGLYLGGRIIYGLADLDDDQYDISRAMLDDNNDYISRSDKNTNLTIQASIGFLF